MTYQITLLYFQDLKVTHSVF